MRIGRWMTGIGLGTLAVAGLSVAPALQARETNLARAPQRQATVFEGGISTFTPASADPKLAAMLARSGVPANGFGFTPSESRRAVNPTVTVAVGRIGSIPSAQVIGSRASPAPAPVSLAPISYNLGVSAGWKSFAVSGDAARVDLVSQTGSSQRGDFGLSYGSKRTPSKVTAAAVERPLVSAPASGPTLLSDQPSTLDVGGSYSLTRNFDVTAGVRYKAERDRLPRLTDNRRDSQAVYVGTAFRF
jgi:hypothetical protein